MMRAMRPVALLLATAVVALLTGACGGSSSGGTPSTGSSTTAAATAPADSTTATADIKKLWSTFFAASTPVAKGKALLEDGDQLGPALALAQQVRKSSSIDQRAKVKTVTFTSPTNADVSYVLYNGKTVLLPSAAGKAVYIDGQWKVSKDTFCALVSLGANGKAVPGC